MGLIGPWYNPLVIIALQPVKKMLGINPIGHSDTWGDSPDIIYLYPIKDN